MAKKNNTLWGILGIILAIFIIAYLNRPLSLLVEEDMALYHYAGYAPKDPSPGSNCQPIEPFSSNMIGGSDNFGLRPESSFEIGNSKFRIVTNNVRWVRLKDEVTAGKINREEQRYCSNRVFYDTDVYKDDALIESIRFTEPSSCDDIEVRKDPIIRKVYQADSGSVNITFHATRDLAISFYPDSRCRGHALVGHKIELQQPSDIFIAMIKKTEVKNNQLLVTVETNAKYHSLLGKVGVRVGVPTILGERSIEQEINTDFIGEQEHTFVFNLTTDGGLTFTPYYTVYDATTRLNNLYGSGIFEKKLLYQNGIIKYRTADYMRYLIAKGEGQAYLVQIKNQTTNTTAISQPVTPPAPVLTPQIPTSEKAGTPMKKPFFDFGDTDVIIGTIFLVIMIVLIIVYMFIRRRRRR